jgi:hypothetical protein
MAKAMTQRILVLFADEWDRAAVRDPRFRGRFEFAFEGFDLFRFPENTKLAAWRCAPSCRRFVCSQIDFHPASHEAPSVASLLAQPAVGGD